MRMKRYGDGNGLLVNLSITGNSVNFFVNQEDIKNYNKRLKESGITNIEDLDENNTSVKYDDEYETDKEHSFRMSNRVKSTKNNMIKAFTKIKSKPNLFITLSFKTERLTTELFKNKQRWECLHNFVRNIRYAYSKSWFFVVAGFTKYQGLHFHIIAYVDYDSWCDYNYFASYAREKWQNQLFGTNNRDCFDIKPYKKIHISYLTSNKKNWEYKALREENEKCRIYTLIGKKNIEFFTSIKYMLDVDELDKLQKKLESYFQLKGIKADSISNQFMYWSGRISFIPHKVLKKAINDILKERTLLIKHTLLPED